MKQIIKPTLCIICLVSGMLILLAGCFYYETSYKRTIRDTSVSVDGVYELTLIEIGEPAWPFGPASGRLILNEGDTQISETNFKLANDGCSISSNDWAVTWGEDYVEVILSGEEQYDEQILLYYDGTTQRQTLMDETEPTVTQSEVEIKKLEMGVVDTPENNLVFEVSIDDYIEGYNGAYRQANSADYLSASSDWSAMLDITPFLELDAIHYRFSANEQIWSMPTVSIYTPENSDYIYEIELTFDDHGYQEALYEEFKQICFYSLKVVLPELSDTEINSLYKELYLQTNNNFWGDYYTYGDTERPMLTTIYCYNGIGFYGYYGAGTANICMIPVTQEFLLQLEKESIEIREIIVQ